MTRATLYVLLPLSIVVAFLFATLGVPQTLSASVEATTLEGPKQIIALGPVASQEAIKLIGDNGGGFFNANSARPFVSPIFMVGFAGASAILKIALDSLGAGGPHGLSEILYAYPSSVADNGSAFGGLNANTPWYNVTTGVAMFVGRFAHAIPVLAIAGPLAAKKKAAPTAGTLPTHGALFVVFLIGVMVVFALLQYLPALALGPIAEQFLLGRGTTF